MFFDLLTPAPSLTPVYVNIPKEVVPLLQQASAPAVLEPYPTWFRVAKAKARLPPLPLDTLNAYPHHCATICPTDLSLITYYPNPHASTPKPVTLKPGRYLAQFYPSLPAHVVRDWVLTHFTPAVYQLHFASTPEDIERVYINGPGSCMSKPLVDDDDEDSGFHHHVHPSTVYATPDLQVAYLTKSDNPRTLLARALTCHHNPPERHYSRVYGTSDNQTHLRKLLLEAGYTSGSMHGARIRRITTHHSSHYYIVPYIDHHASVQGSPESLYICRSPDPNYFLIHDESIDDDPPYSFTSAGETTGEVYFNDDAS